jgi:cation-transporting ATPase 13A1
VVGGGESVHIAKRFPFSPTLQRMSVVARLNSSSTTTTGAAAPTPPPHHHHQTTLILVKGSPEAMAPLLKPSSKPLWYEGVYRRLAMNGTRVLALAWREGGDPHAERAAVESNLTFAGFAAFTTRVRADTAEVIAQLKGAGMAVCVVSGDALLTCQYVARRVGILRGTKLAVLETGEGGALEWWAGAGKSRRRLGGVKETEKVARAHELCATG